MSFHKSFKSKTIRFSRLSVVLNLTDKIEMKYNFALLSDDNDFNYNDPKV